MATDHYAVLGVERDAPRSQIRKRYLEAAKKMHPDKHHGAATATMATATFEHVQAAYKVLYDPEQRAAYDAETARLAKPMEAPLGPSGPSWLERRKAMPQGPVGLGCEWLHEFRRKQRMETKYRHFSKQRALALSVAKPALGILGVFLAFRTLPVLLLSSDPPVADRGGQRPETAE
mmetsp:Transcript_61606/g.133357  ORF Transcript_61606/g.133357 Transcript_61606/m.133357 type:complete len:176 (+) Transcript_61606:67-594(+)